METRWKAVIWQQFGAAIDMLENAITACPEHVWGDRSQLPEFWYLAYHTLFFLDLYTSESDAGFAPPAPFTLGELDPEGVLPDRVYAKAELLAYLEFGRSKTRARITALTEETGARPCAFDRRNISNRELLLYNMRHVQHHAAQLNLLLRQRVNSAPKWVSVAREAL